MFQKIKFFVLSAASILIGMKVTLKNLFGRRVTLNYPLEKQPMKSNFRGMVDLIPKACVICYQCIKICPVAALDLGHQQDTLADGKKEKAITKFTFNAELCCFCGFCEEICPTDAIFLNKMYEVSAFEHDDLLNINLMDAAKYKHIDSNYNFEQEAKKMEKPAVEVKLKPAPDAPVPPARAPGPAPENKSSPSNPTSTSA